MPESRFHGSGACSAKTPQRGKSIQNVSGEKRMPSRLINSRQTVSRGKERRRQFRGQAESANSGGAAKGRGEEQKKDKNWGE